MSTRYAAKNTTSSTFAASPGWKLIGPNRTHSRAPLISLPIPGSEGSSNAAMPSSRNVYLYRSSVRMLRTTMSVTTNAAMPTAVQIACTRARSRSSREMVM